MTTTWAPRTRSQAVECPASRVTIDSWMILPLGGGVLNSGCCGDVAGRRHSDGGPGAVFAKVEREVVSQGESREAPRQRSSVGPWAPRPGFAASGTAGPDGGVAPVAGAAEDEAMTAVAERTKQSEVVNCEVRCAGTDEVLGYVVAGGSAGCLERALADNGLWLVPATPRSLARKPAHAAA